MHAQACARRGAPRIELGLHRVGASHENERDVRVPRLEFKRGVHRDAGAVIAPHAIDGDDGQRDYSSLVLMTFLPR